MKEPILTPPPRTAVLPVYPTVCSTVPSPPNNPAGSEVNPHSMIRYRFMTIESCHFNPQTESRFDRLLKKALHVPAKNMASECGILCTDYPHDCSGFGYTADGDCILFHDTRKKGKISNHVKFERCYVRVEGPSNSC